MDARTARLDAAIDRALAERRIVGTVVVVAQGGAIVYERAAGFADREARSPVRMDTLFRLASLTKPIVSAAALALVDRGVLALDDLVARRLPAFAPHAIDGSAPPITLRHLLTHTAGLRYGFLQPPGSAYERAGISDGLDQPALPLDENLRRIASVPLQRQPGTRWEYSLATDVLGALLAATAGASLPDVVETFVTGPLELRDTAFAVRDVARLAVPYADDFPEPRRMREPDAVPFVTGGGMLRFSPARAFAPGAYPSGGTGMVGSARDLVRFFEAIRTDGAPILTPERARAMTSNQIGDLAVDLSGPGFGFGFGAAIVLDPAAARTPLSRGAFRWGGVYGNHWFVDPARQRTLVSLSNTSVEGMAGRFALDVRDAACMERN
ncbi:hypothetical protein WPS_12890 [Vulcanimicrobium alpinum]|uniref:Beta-lactamase-related domain-containing protein n=1 Tax=Vulcanimicrobium alpinum TaxID=3016050 RepID=A0AAN2C9I1_UNVUL|nr:serine hydrolase domain-containing protein [Vulcanimicrobium alpinum]BDE06013.1 hypothetical protein WPS_12890 [Vulcanimicrobium alpinum]